MGCDNLTHAGNPSLRSQGSAAPYGAWLKPPWPTGIFVAGGGAVVPDLPAINRVFVRFTDAGGALRGETSVAVRTQSIAMGSLSRP
jgi:hypothetical protein